MQHAIVARGDVICGLWVADFSSEHATTTLKHAIIVAVVIHRSKMNRAGGNEHLTMYHQKDARRCLVGAMFL